MFHNAWCTPSVRGYRGTSVFQSVLPTVCWSEPYDSTFASRCMWLRHFAYKKMLCINGRDLSPTDVRRTSKAALGVWDNAWTWDVFLFSFQMVDMGCFTSYTQAGHLIDPCHVLGCLTNKGEENYWRRSKKRREIAAVGSYRLTSARQDPRDWYFGQSEHNGFTECHIKKHSAKFWSDSDGPKRSFRRNPNLWAQFIYPLNFLEKVLS